MQQFLKASNNLLNIQYSFSPLPLTILRRNITAWLQDSRNNTYTCLRTLGQEDSVFCQFEDSDNFMEMYNLAQDRHQLINLAYKISQQTINFYKVIFFNSFFPMPIIPPILVTMVFSVIWSWEVLTSTS